MSLRKLISTLNTNKEHANKKTSETMREITDQDYKYRLMHGDPDDTVNDSNHDNDSDSPNNDDQNNTKTDSSENDNERPYNAFISSQEDDSSNDENPSSLTPRP